MGGSSKQTLGYHYLWLMHLAWMRSADAITRLRFGGVDAWQGRITSNTRLSIDKPDLWGGEEAEGGVVGELDILFGGPDQAPNDYLISVFGPEQSGNRALVTTLLRGARYGAFMPNPKGTELQAERIFSDPAGDEQWYPEKARIVLSGEAGTPGNYIGQNGGSNGGSSTPLENYQNDFYVPDWSAHPNTRLQFTCLELPPSYVLATYPRRHFFLADGVAVWDSGWYGLTADQDALDALLIAAGRIDLLGAIMPGIPSYVWDRGSSEPLMSTDSFVAVIPDARPNIFTCTAELRTAPTESTEIAGMNPAHMIYESIVHPDMQGEPAGLIDEASFSASADTLYSEAFGLCTEYDSDQEDPEQFRQRILDIIGGTCHQSRIDGKYYLDLARGNYVLEDLPIITQADLISFEQESSLTTETVNCVRVEWFDPVENEDRSTRPIFAPGQVRSAGEVIPEVLVRREVPTASLAARVGKSHLNARSKPLSRFNLVLRRRFRDKRPGQYVRLQLPSEGIGDMVCIFGGIGHGTHADGRLRFQAVQDVFSMPATVYVGSEPGEWVPPATVPQAPEFQRAMEAPFLELASALTPADQAALASDVGYLLTMAARPAAGISYDVLTAALGEAFERRGSGEWCPSFVVSTASNQLVTTLNVTGVSDLSRIAIGSWALWDEEIIRIDGYDVDTGVLTVGRGCGDTVPMPHLASSRIYLVGDWPGTDGREYVDGDTVSAKLLTRLSTAVLNPSGAPTLVVNMSQRQSRPYPPGRLRVTDVLGADWVFPSVCVGELTISWSHRDRLLQADQVIETEHGNIGPEPGTTYTVRFYLDGMLDHEETSIAGTVSTPVTLSGDGLVLLQVIALRDGLESWQAAWAIFNYQVDASDVRITDDGDTRITDSGDRRITD